MMKSRLCAPSVLASKCQNVFNAWTNFPEWRKMKSRW